MANTTSAQKAVRKIATRTAANKSRRTQMRSHIRKVEEAIASGDASQAAQLLGEAAPLIARSAQKGLIHKKTGSRKISRLTQRVKAMSASA